VGGCANRAEWSITTAPSAAASAMSRALSFHRGPTSGEGVPRRGPWTGRQAGRTFAAGSALVTDLPAGVGATHDPDRAVLPLPLPLSYSQNFGVVLGIRVA
jgi:hypothetical protein